MMKSRSSQQENEDECSPEWTFKAEKVDGTAVQIRQDVLGEIGLLSKNSLTKKLKAAGYKVEQIEIKPPSSIKAILS